MKGEEQGTRGELFTYIDKMEQLRQEQSKTTMLRLSKEMPFDRESGNQQFYRQIMYLHQKEVVIIKKLGWKVVEVEKHQEDLLLYCFNLLTSSNFHFPLNVFTNTRLNQDETLTKTLWMEVAIHASDTSLDQYEVEESIEVKVYHLCQQKLLPLFVSFIGEHMQWSQMIKEENSSQKIALLFEEKVIAVANKMIANDLSRK